jgi:hypothetical protein
MTYKIEVFSTIEKRWVELPGEPGYNDWDTLEEAEAQFPSLREDPEDKFRAVER